MPRLQNNRDEKSRNSGRKRGTARSARGSSKREAGHSEKVQAVTVHLVSESTGSLARHIAAVALSQYPSLEFQTRNHVFCGSAKDLHQIQTVISNDDGQPLVLSALTKTRLKQALAKWCSEQSIDHFDVMNDVVSFIAQRTSHKPVRDAHRTHRCDADYYRRMEALEFTLQHDDNRRLESIGQADLILLGVSRVGKTPLAAYLGLIGFRVANVAIARENKIPAEIVAQRSKVIGLTIDPVRLADIRKRRFELNRFKQAIRRVEGCDHSYYSQKTAFADIFFAEREFRKLGIRFLDMTDMTVEESAIRVLKMVGLEQTN